MTLADMMKDKQPRLTNANLTELFSISFNSCELIQALVYTNVFSQFGNKLPDHPRLAGEQFSGERSQQCTVSFKYRIKCNSQKYVAYVLVRYWLFVDQLFCDELLRLQLLLQLVASQNQTPQLHHLLHLDVHHQEAQCWWVFLQ